MAGVSDILTTLQNGVTSMGDVANQLARQVPFLSSGNVDVTKLIQVGPVRVLGVSVVVAGAAGMLHDVARAADAAAGNAIYVTQATIGFYPLNIVFHDGLVYVLGAGQRVSIHYSRLV